MRISILGAGGWGTTLAILLSNNGHDVSLWEYKSYYATTLRKNRENHVYLPGIKIPEDVDITHSLEKACKNKHLLVLAVPTQYLRGVLKEIADIDFSSTIFVNVSKGIEAGSLKTISQILADTIPTFKECNYSILSGPSHAEEVSRKIPTAVVSASSCHNVSQEVQSIFMNSFFRVYTSVDIIGVELGGALKNVIAIGAGIVDGAGFGDNTKALIMTRGIAEISGLGVAMGANPITFSGLSGMGDLIVTCMSKHSRNRFVGEQLGKGRKLKEILSSMNMVAEGVETCRSVIKLAKQFNVEVPISEAVYEVLFNNEDPVKATYDLMTREANFEHEIEKKTEKT